jgi:hypothetical protein
MTNKSTEQIIIEKLSDERYEYIKQREESWEEEAGHYSVEENPKIDTLADEIFEKIKVWKYSLPFEFIIEELTKLGQSPCLLYDDNGHFAISGDGVQSISIDIEDQELIHFIEKDMWKDSIREALDHYLNNE